MDIVTIFTSFDLGETYYVKTLLENEGIAVETFDEHISSIAPHLLNAIGGIKLVVKSEDVSKAQGIIQGYLQNNGSSNQPRHISSTSKSFECPRCGGREISKIFKPMKLPSIFMLFLTLLPIPIRKKFNFCRQCGVYWK